MFNINRNQIVYGLIGAIIGGLFVWLLSVNYVSNNVSEITRTQAVREMKDNLDGHFIEQMIPHHEGAITMAKKAQIEATHQEIKTLANNIIDSQGAEIEQMQLWYRDWYGKDVSIVDEEINSHGMISKDSSMKMNMMKNDFNLDDLSQSSDFDKAFIEQMIPHHQMAIMMAEMLKSGTTRPEMKKLAEDIILTQSNEINQMRQWYKNWGY